MTIFYYDSTFEGLLCAVFDSFKLKLIPDQLLHQGEVAPLFSSQVHHVETVTSKVDRVQAGLKKRLTNVALNQLMSVWLSELPESDWVIFRYICLVFRSNNAVETDFADPDVLALRKIAQKVHKERHQLMEFVRFNLIDSPQAGKTEKIYFAAVSPNYNTLPLVLSFFKGRFGDQKWAIYDEKRNYGFYYDLNKIERIVIDGHDDLIQGGQINANYLASDEGVFQTMWYKYCQSLSIKERFNPTLQKQHMPKRFWKYLPEMQVRNKKNN